MKNFTSILGWLLLVAVLAVPSFLFYNWWSKGNQQNQAELVHEPLAGNVFPSEKNAPGAVSRQPSAVPPQGLPAAPQAAASSAPASPAAQPPGRPAAQQAETPEQRPPSASSNPPSEVSRQVQEPAVSTTPMKTVELSTKTKTLSYYHPKSNRDPTFSTDDYRRIQEEKERREEIERQRKIALSQRPKEPKPETRINLQGIVGNAAIINGDMYTVGKTVRGVKVLKIGTDYIIGEFNGKKFRKVLK